MPPDSLFLLQKILKNKGYSLTTPRKLVCELLWGKEPLSMHELGELSQDSIDRASLYRTINLFEQLGLVQRIYIGWKYKVELSDLLMHHHHHICCLGCGRIVAISDEASVETLIDEIAARYSFATTSHQLEIRGYCPDCRAAKRQ